MDLLYLKDFFAQYSLPTLVIALSVAIINFIVKKFTHKKLPNLFFSYLPFGLAVIFYIAYDMIALSKAFTVTVESVYAGLLSGSLSLVITSIGKRIAKGKPLSVTTTAMLIEGIISGYVREDALSQTASKVDTLISDNKAKDNHNEIVALLKQNSEDSVSEEQLQTLAGLITRAVLTNEQSEKQSTTN